MRILLLCGVLITALVSAQAGATSSQTGAALPKVGGDPEKLICKRQEVIGSLIARKRVCATARNWERNEALAKEHLDVLTAPGAFSSNR